jgi:hypothetical protein
LCKKKQSQSKKFGIVLAKNYSKKTPPYGNVGQIDFKYFE